MRDCSRTRRISPALRHAMLNGGHPILRPATVELFTRRETTPNGTSRALGWDTPSALSQSGNYFSQLSFGHLGYTGTSLWIDPARQLSVTLLTNRTWPDCQNQAIKQVRPAFHDAILEALHIERLPRRSSRDTQEKERQSPDPRNRAAECSVGRSRLQVGVRNRPHHQYRRCTRSSCRQAISATDCASDRLDCGCAC